MSNSELKPCPFCKVNPVEDVFDPCDAFSTLEVACVNPDCPIYMKGMTREAWNTRPANDLREKVEKIIGGYHNLADGMDYYPSPQSFFKDILKLIGEHHD